MRRRLGRHLEDELVVLEDDVGHTSLQVRELSCKARDVDDSWLAEPVQKEEGFCNLLRKLPLEADMEFRALSWIVGLKAAELSEEGG